MVKQCNIYNYGQSVQLINYGPVWCQYWIAIQNAHMHDNTFGTKLYQRRMAPVPVVDLPGMMPHWWSEINSID